MCTAGVNTIIIPNEVTLPFLSQRKKMTYFCRLPRHEGILKTKSSIMQKGSKSDIYLASYSFVFPSAASLRRRRLFRVSIFMLKWNLHASCCHPKSFPFHICSCFCFHEDCVLPRWNRTDRDATSD